MASGPIVPGPPAPGSGRRPGPPGVELRLADLLASLSLVADLGFGLPSEQSMRSCLASTALARRMGMSESQVTEVFYTALLEHIGCSGFAHEAAARYGDELVVNAAIARTNTADPRDLFGTFLPALTQGRGPLGRARVVLAEIAQGDRVGRVFATAACEVGRATARRLGLSAGVQRGLHEVYEQWNGKSGAHGLGGETISVVARITQVGATASLFGGIGGREHAVAAVRKRAGSLLDPSIVAAFVGHSDAVLADAEADDAHAAVLGAEPTPVQSVPAGRLEGVAAAFADIPDLKSPFLLGHSSEVARLAGATAAVMGLDARLAEHLRVAALLHDLGRVGISNAVWERRGPLTAAQWEQVRLHPYHSERILARSAALTPLAEIAGMHHERLNGSGYHRGSGRRELPLAARILAAADMYQAMRQARPHRPALAPDDAEAQLLEAARAGRLDADAVSAVLGAAGHGRPRTRSATPGGLSDREVEVLQAVAAGLTNREIAARFSISQRTAEHHVQHIYDKLGFSSRAAAALFAMEHDLLR